MARSNSGSTSNYLEMTLAPVTTFPVTIIAKVKLAGIANGEQCVLRIGSTLTRDDMIALEINNADVWAITGANTSFTEATKGTLSAGVWTNVAAVFTSATSRTAYKSGVAGTIDTTSKDFTAGTINRTNALVYYFPPGGTPYANPFNGEVAEIAVYQAALTAAELLDYENGVRPIERLRTGALRAYWKMNDGTGDETNYTNAPSAYTLVKAGTVGQTTHPSVTAYAADGTLSVLLSNRRYLTVDGVTPFFLVGSDHWQGLVDYSASAAPTTPTNYTAQFAIEAARGSNWIRMFTWDYSRLNGILNTQDFFAPLAYRRTGPGNAVDGGLKFDLTLYDTDYFARMRAIIQLAATYGMHVVVMLFEGLDAQSASTWKVDGHPYASTNNINSITGESAGTMLQCYTRNVAAINTKQDAYVTKVLDTTYDLPNVIYEIANEADTNATCDAWQSYWCDFIRSNEQSRPATYRHLILRSASNYVTSDETIVTTDGGDLTAPHFPWSGYGTFAAPLLTIEVSAANPPRLYDGDHTIAGSYITPDPFWKAVTSGHAGVTYMDDPYGSIGSPPSGYPSATIRANLSYIKTLANRLHLATCVPSTALASTAYCLANAGSEYLVYQPGSAAFTVDLSAAAAVGRRFNAEWLNTNTGAKAFGPAVIGGSAAQSFTSPFVGVSGLVLLLTPPSALVARPAVVTRPRPFAPGLAR